MRQQLREQYPDAYIRIRKYNFSITTSHTVEVEFTGPDPAVLRDLSAQAEAVMRRSPYVDAYSVQNNWKPTGKSFVAEYVQQDALRSGIVRGDVAGGAVGCDGRDARRRIERSGTHGNAQPASPQQRRQPYRQPRRDTGLEHDECPSVERRAARGTLRRQGDERVAGQGVPLRTARKCRRSCAARLGRRCRPATQRPGVSSRRSATPIPTATMPRPPKSSLRFGTK